LIEVKTRRASPTASQLDTQLKIHHRLWGDGTPERINDNLTIMYWGYAIIRLEHTTPLNGRIFWQHMSIDEKSKSTDTWRRLKIDPVEISERQLIDLFLFKRNWQTLKRMTWETVEDLS